MLLLRLIILILVMLMIVVLNKKKFPLGLTLIIGAIILVISNFGFSAISYYLFLTLTNNTTLELLIAVSLIQILGYMIRETGRMKRVVKSLYEIFSDFRTLLMIIPSVIALIPGPGVVMLTAPMIEEVSKEVIPPNKKAFINFWFRAAIHFCNPISFAFIIAISLTNVNTKQLFLMQLPLTIIMLFSGYLLELKKLPREVDGFVRVESNEKKILKSIFVLLKNCSFLLLILFSTLILDFRMSWAIGLSLLLVYIQEKITLHDLLKIFRKGFSWKMATLVFGMMFFSIIVEESSIIEGISSLWVQLGMPVEVLLLILPLLIGWVVGAYSGAVAVTFALLTPIIQSYNLGIISVGVVYSLSKIGVILSPVNSSVLLSVEYFKASLLHVQKKFMMALPIPTVVIVVLYLLETI